MLHEFDYLACAESLSVLAHPVRLGIVFALLRGTASPKRLALASQASRKGIFYHLDLLQQAGVVVPVEIENAVEYSLRGVWVETADGRRGFRIELRDWRVLLLAAETSNSSDAG